MKTFKLIVFLCLISQFIKGQDYVPFPTDSAIWVEDWVIGDMGTIDWEGQTIYILLGDSTISGLNYSILWETSCADFEDLGCRDIQGFIREEE